MKNSIIFSLMILISLSLVCAVPMIPTVFNGTVIYSVNPAVSLYGLNINVSIGSSISSTKIGTVQSGNHYEVMVDPMGVSGDFHFYVGDVEAIETGTYVRGGFILQDLTINTIPTGTVSQYCGDSTCNNGETCTSCSGDCGSCGSSGNGGHSSGGGSSGGSSSPVIVLNNPTTNTNSNTGSGGVAITGNTVANSANSKGIISSGALLIALIIAVIVLGIVVLLIPKRK